MKEPYHDPAITALIVIIILVTLLAIILVIACRYRIKDAV